MIILSFRLVGRAICQEGGEQKGAIIDQYLIQNARTSQPYSSQKILVGNAQEIMLGNIHSAWKSDVECKS